MLLAETNQKRLFAEIGKRVDFQKIKTILDEKFLSKLRFFFSVLRNWHVSFTCFKKREVKYHGRMNT